MIHSDTFNDLAEGDVVKITGRTGQYTFIRHTVTSKAEHLTFFGGDKNPEGHRQFISTHTDIKYKKVKQHATKH